MVPLLRDATRKMPNYFVLLISFGIVPSALCQTTQSSINNDTLAISESSTTTSDFMETTERIFTTEASQLDMNTDLGPCICDLTVNGCDVNCCCDTDCSNDDKGTFSYCIDQNYLVDDKICIQDSVVFRSNIPEYVEVSDPSLFCVHKDNYVDRNYYTIPEPVTSVEDFDQLSSQYEAYSYRIHSETNVTYPDYYKSGDAIYTMYETLSLGMLGLPQSLTTGECVDTNPAAFLHDTTSSCTRHIPDLSSSCESLPAFSARTFTDGFKVVSTPRFLQEYQPPEIGQVNGSVTPVMTPTTSNSTEETPSTEDVLNYYDRPELISVDVLQPLCRSLVDVNCSFVDIPFPVYNETLATCRHVLLEVRYVITHNATEGIEATSVQVVLGGIQYSELPLVQRFKISFIKSGQTEEPFLRSGNPGYIVGEPLMAGTRMELKNKTKLAIALRDDRNNWLTVIKSSADGTCLTDADSRIPVTFGEDVRTGCIINISLNSNSDVCDLIQNQILNALKGPLPDDYYVAMFGNSSVEIVGDWVPVLHEEIAGAPSSPAVGTCSNMVTGQHIEVIYANVGSLQNPQPKIVGVKYNYADGKLLKYQCLGSSCQSDFGNTIQRFEITSSVTFIDGSTQPEAVIAERPSWESKLPNDFLYPFTGSSMVSTVEINIVTMVTLILISFVT